MRLPIRSRITRWLSRLDPGRCCAWLCTRFGAVRRAATTVASETLEGYVRHGAGGRLYLILMALVAALFTLAGCVLVAGAMFRAAHPLAVLYIAFCMWYLAVLTWWTLITVARGAPRTRWFAVASALVLGLAGLRIMVDEAGLARVAGLAQVLAALQIIVYFLRSAEFEQED